MPNKKPNFKLFQKQLEEMEKILGVHFEDKNLPQEALIHRSYLNEHPDCSLQHNERLEFLGDSVLELLVSEHLYKEFKKPEGEMTNLRSALVNTDILGKIAKGLKIGNYLCLSKGEARDTGRARTALLANTLEAIIGAIYLDQGLEKTRQFVEENILNTLPGVLKKKIIKDPKTQFQEMAQERLRITPHYEVLQEWGPDHERRFLVGLYLNKRVIAKGEGFSKQEAEEKAAYEALKTMENQQSGRLK